MIKKEKKAWLKEKKEVTTSKRSFVFILFVLSCNVSIGKRFEFANEDLACEAIGTVPNVCNEWMQEAGSVEMDCKFNIRSGLWASSSSDDGKKRNRGVHVGPAIILRYGEEGYITLEPHSHNKTRTFEKQNAPIICEHDLPNFIPASALTGSEDLPEPVLLLVASSIEYLWKLWPFFVQKVLWADSIQMRLAIWIGELPIKIATSVSKDCLFNYRDIQRHYNSHHAHNEPRKLKSVYEERDDHNGTSPLNSNHYIKMLATYAVLQFSSLKVGGLFYVDMDTLLTHRKIGGYSNQFAAQRMALVHLNYKKDVYFYQIHHGDAIPGRGPPSPFWLVKTHHYYVRNTIFGRRFILAWLHWRCGFKDQIAIWHTIVKFAESAGCLKDAYHDDIYKFEYSYFFQNADKLKLWLPDNINIDRYDCSHKCPDFLFDCSTNKDFDLKNTVPLLHEIIDSVSTRIFFYFDPVDQTRHSIRVQSTPAKDDLSFLIYLNLTIVHPAAII